MVNSPGVAVFRILRGPVRRLSPNWSRYAKVVRQPRSPHPCDPHANLLCLAPKPPRASISHANPHPIPAHTNAQASKWCVPYHFIIPHGNIVAAYHAEIVQRREPAAV